MPLSLSRSVEPTSKPVTVSEVKSFLRVTHSEDDSDINALIGVATRVEEDTSERSFINTTWVWKLDDFPRCGNRTMRVPMPPLGSVTSITYVDTNGDTQTLAASKYTVDASSRPGRITESHGNSWPNVRDVVGAVTITFVAGYGTTRDDVPADARHAIKMNTIHLYGNRGDCSDPKALEAMGQYLRNSRSGYAMPTVR